MWGAPVSPATSKNEANAQLEIYRLTHSEQLKPKSLWDQHAHI
jgi:hypothetical protein